MNHLQTLISFLEQECYKSIEEIIPPQETESFYRSIYTEFNNGGSLSVPLNKKEYELYVLWSVNQT